MKILVIYAHPSEVSFTTEVKNEFIRGLKEAGHTVEISDLYKMEFQETMTEQEYLREAFYREDSPIPSDVIEEQRKIKEADILAFIYPVFWTEAPAKLVGWFQRVWTYGFAYGDHPSMHVIQKAVFLVTMGGSLQDEIRRQQAEAMKTVMLGDRISDRALKKEMYFFDRMTRGYGNDETREANRLKFLQQVHALGLEIKQ